MSRGGARGAVVAPSAAMDAMLPRALGAAVDQFAYMSKRKAARRLLEAMGPTRKRVMQLLWETVKETATKDPDMPRLVKSQVHVVIDSVAGDVERQTEEKLMLTTGIRETRDARALWEERASSTRSSRACCCSSRCTSCWGRIRGRLLYAVAPSDKTIWGSLRDPLWWIWVVLSLGADFGIRTVVFTLLLVLLMCPGPPDEYQLTRFILVIKVNQFLTAGVGCMLVSSMQYYSCVIFTRHDVHACLDVTLTSGPFMMWYTMVDYIGSFLLTQFAKLAFHRAKRLSPALTATGVELKDPTPEPMSCCGCCQVHHPAPYRLRLALRYDLVCFLLSVLCLVLLTVFTSSHGLHGLHTLVCDPVTDPDCKPEDPSLALNAYWCRELYALMVFPFVLAWAPDWTPVSFSMITRASRTGYDRDGRIALFGLRSRARSRSDSDDDLEARSSSSEGTASEDESSSIEAMSTPLAPTNAGWFNWRYYSCAAGRPM